jgi:hypothetical protein
MEKIVKTISHFFSRVNNFQPLSQIAIDDYEIKIIKNGQVKIPDQKFLLMST